MKYNSYLICFFGWFQMWCWIWVICLLKIKYSLEKLNYLIVQYYLHITWLIVCCWFIPRRVSTASDSLNISGVFKFPISVFSLKMIH